MDYYQNNIKLLQKHRTPFYNLYEKISKNMEWKYLCEEIVSQEAKDGSVILRVKREGRFIRLNSPYRPVEEAQKWASQFSGDNMHVNAMIFGLGNGMFARALLQRLQRDAKLFICEPSFEIFETALHQMDFEDLLVDERILLCVEDINGDDFFNLLRDNTHWTNLETQICCHHTGYEVLFPEAYRDYLLSVKKVSQIVQVNKDTQAFFSQKMVPSMLDNMAYLREARIITDYVGKFPKDIPAIIVAAGPSLDKNIEELKRAKGKAFILAVDTAMRHLIKHGILPDAMVTLDTGKPFRYMNDPVLKDIPLFCILESNREIMAFHEGIKIWFQGSSFLGDFFARHNKEFVEYNPGGSVATAAFAVCAALEFERIVLVGQDLAYEGDVTHAGGEVSRVLNEEHGLKMIEGIDGKQVKSRYDWIIYLDWFEEAISVLKGRIEVIDATEGGALIHGSTLMTLAEVIDRYCKRDVDISAIFAAQVPMFTKQEYEDVRKELLEYVPELKEMREKAYRAQRDCDRALDLLKKDATNKKLDQLQRSVLKITEQIPQYKIYNMVDLYISKTANKYLSGVFVVSDNSHQDEMNMYHSSKMIFEGMVESIDALLPLFEEMSEKV